jgi:hypothetical protein
VKVGARERLRLRVETLALEQGVVLIAQQSGERGHRVVGEAVEALRERGGDGAELLLGTDVRHDVAGVARELRDLAGDLDLLVDVATARLLGHLRHLQRAVGRRLRGG